MSNTNYRRGGSTAGFTLVELMVVLTIILIMVGVGVAAFKGGNNSDGTRGAAAVASGEFNLARNEAIMRQTTCRVVIDTAWSASRTDLADHYLRRMTVAYLNPQGVAVGGLPAAANNLPVDTGNATNWLQTDNWIVLPGNTYFDNNYSAMHGSSMNINFGGQNNPTSGYAYYEFSPNGQAQYSSLTRYSQAGSTNVTTTQAQCILSPGRVDTSGNFQERNPSFPTGACYGFVLFRMGNISFFQNISDITAPTS